MLRLDLLSSREQRSESSWTFRLNSWHTDEVSSFFFLFFFFLALSFHSKEQILDEMNETFPRVQSYAVLTGSLLEANTFRLTTLIP